MGICVTRPSLIDEAIEATPMCVEGYTRIIPSMHLNKPGKRQLCKYGYSDNRPKYYGDIHLTLPDKSNPNDPWNLGPKPRINEWDVAREVPPKFVTYRMVCVQDEAVTTAEIQQAVTANLIDAWKKLCIVRVTFLISL